MNKLLNLISMDDKLLNILNSLSRYYHTMQSLIQCFNVLLALQFVKIAFHFVQLQLYFRLVLCQLIQQSPRIAQLLFVERLDFGSLAVDRLLLSPDNLDQPIIL